MRLLGFFTVKILAAIDKTGQSVCFALMDILLTRRMALAAAAGAMPLTAALGRPGQEMPQARRFDFLMGRWKVRHRKLRERLEGSRDWAEFDGTLDVSPILGGLGNFDRNELADPAGAYEAHSLRLYNPASDQWSIWWLDGRSPELTPPVAGRFDGDKGRFYADETFNGRPVRVRTTYEPLGAGRAEWTQAFSPDGGRSWEVNWIMDFRKVRA